MAAPSLLDLHITVVSAKHLKNVNWRNGDLKPYVVLYLDSDRRLATHSDDSGSTRPVWNERFTLPLTCPIHDSVLFLEILHSKPSDTPRPFVGSAHFPLARLLDSEESPNSLRTLELIRPSGRPQGKVRIKLAIKERTTPPPPPPAAAQQQVFHNAPQSSYYYSSAPPPPSTAGSPAPYYREFSPSAYSYSDQYFSGYYYHPPRPMYCRASSHGLPSGPSAPDDMSSSDDRKPPPRTSNYCVPSGPSAPVDFSPCDHKQLQKGMGGLSLEDEKTTEKVETDFPARESYSYAADYRRY